MNITSQYCIFPAMFTEQNAFEMPTDAALKQWLWNLGIGWPFHHPAGMQWDKFLIVNSKWDIAEGGMS